MLYSIYLYICENSSILNRRIFKDMKDSISKSYNWFIAIFWLTLILMLYPQFTGMCPFGETTLFATLFFLITFPLTTYLSKYILPKTLMDNKMNKFIVCFLLFTLALAFLMACVTNGIVWLEKNGVFPASLMFSGMAKPLYLESFGNLLSAFALNSVFCAIRFIEVHYKMKQEHAKLQRAHLEDQLHLLRAQINPHLMFNVLNHIHILMKKNVDMADELLLRYSDVLRYQLYECNREIVSLEKEVDYLIAIVEIEKIRWGNELRVDCVWDIDNGEQEISPLLLIPFVENAFKHVSRMPSEVGYVKIDLHKQGNVLQLEVENSNSEQPLHKQNASGLGLENIKKRLEILYPQKHELSIRETGTVYKTTLTITL